MREKNTDLDSDDNERSGTDGETPQRRRQHSKSCQEVHPDFADPRARILLVSMEEEIRFRLSYWHVARKR